MFDNINKSKIKFEKYIELKTKTLSKSYTENFKWVDKFLYWFSWFGNGVSIFLAFFFIQALFNSSFADVKDSIFITIGIVFFLSIFELLKRYVFELFSVEFIKNKFSIFRTNMISFIVGVLILVVGSFYFSLNGAMKFVDNNQVFKSKMESNITVKTDSINTFYLNQYIKPLMNDNKILMDQNTDYSNQASKTTYKTKFTELITDNNKKIESNKSSIERYEQRRDKDISLISDYQNDKLSETLDINSSNIISFIILSSLVELIIMFGIYYDKFYDYKILEEYEKTVISTPEFKNWYEYNNLLKLIYSKSKFVGDQLPSSNALIELNNIKGVKISKSSLDKFIKILYHIEIVKLQGNRRVLNMVESDGLNKLKSYFDIK